MTFRGTNKEGGLFAASGNNLFHFNVGVSLQAKNKFYLNFQVF
jgi:hypothetical protein